MENKERYFNALIENKGQLNEIDLGEKIGLDEDETREIIARLLSEHKIEYIDNQTCHYGILRNSKKKNKKGW